MKSKKKIGLLKRIAAGVCAVVVTALCVVGSEAYYAIDNEWYIPDGMNLVPGCIGNGTIPHEDKIISDYSCDIPRNYIDDYGPFYVLMGSLYDSSKFYLAIANIPISVNLSSGCYLGWDSDCYDFLSPIGAEDVIMRVFKSTDNGSSWSLQWGCNWVDGTGYFAGDYNSPPSCGITDVSKNDYEWWYGLCETNHYVVAGSGGVSQNEYEYLWAPTVNFDDNAVKEKYNSSLGYLQDIKCKELYLEDAEYAYDPNYLKNVWTFSDSSTTGLDITDGSYSIRHYQQITVRDTDISDPIVKEYDMLLMNEFPAADLRYEYMSKDYSSRLQTESGFESLGFWETSILGQFVHTRNYFQLVRTNEDGSVEYGGYVKIDLKGSPGQNDLNAESECTTVTPEGATDSDGYVGGNMDYTQGSGSDYGQAENEADKNATNSSTSGNELSKQINDVISTVTALPEIFSRLFSFLPPWCLNFFGISVALAGGVLVWKALRG